MAEITRGQAVAGIVVILIAAYAFVPDFQTWVQDIFAGEEGEEETGQVYQNNGAAETGDSTQAPGYGEAAQQTYPKPVYQIGTTYRYIMDAIDKKSGIAATEVEVLDVPAAPYSHGDLVSVASNIDRQVIDETTSTPAGGRANFTHTAIFTETPYIYSHRGAATWYDRLDVKTIPAPVGLTAPLTAYTFPQKDNVYVYVVGAFTDLTSNATLEDYTCGNNLQVTNVTAHAAVYLFSEDIQIGQGTSGAALLDPVLVFRGIPGVEPPANSISHIYLTRKTGTAYNIPGGDLVDYYENEQAIHLGGSIYDSDYGKYLMGAQDSGTYTLKVQYDGAVMTTGSILAVCLDDVGGYRAMDEISKNRKAPTVVMNITWCA